MALSPLLRNGRLCLAILLPLLLTVWRCSIARAQESAWVQAVAGGGFEVRMTTRAPVCPAIVTDRGKVAMTPRAAADARFPSLCVAPVARDWTQASVAGLSLPLPKARPDRILVLGDTGCRIAGQDFQDCSDRRKWPFPTIAAAAANLKPDLVIHVGDFLYRESPCPAGDAGCAGSPWGDNWPTWAADFFTPAAPLLAAAPIVAARGNHEDCSRSGAGFLRLLGAFAFDPDHCASHRPVYEVDLGGLTLAVMDDATAADTEVNRDDLSAYAAEIAGLAALPAPVWLVHHRPIWAPITGPFGIPVGGNRTLIAAAGETLIPSTVTLMLSGHIHAFEAIDYNKGVPPQIVAGNGGDELHQAPRDLRGAIFQGRSGVMVKDGLSAGGFGFLLFTRDEGDEPGWTIALYRPVGTMEGQCRFTPASDERAGRVACPDLVSGK
jgi:hypothetical protein